MWARLGRYLIQDEKHLYLLIKPIEGMSQLHFDPIVSSWEYDWLQKNLPESSHNYKIGANADGTVSLTDWNNFS